jgi:hypothetical protein
VTLTVVVAEVPPPAAITVIVLVALAVLLATDTVIVVAPDDESELGENETVSPLLIPEAENVTVPVTAPESVIVELDDDPRDIVNELGEAERV